MKKTDLVDEVAKVVGTKKMAKDAIDCVFDTVKKSLLDGEGIQLIGFGIFKVVEVPKRERRNPATGEAVSVPAHRKVKFNPTKALRRI